MAAVQDEFVDGVASTGDENSRFTVPLLKRDEVEELRDLYDSLSSHTFCRGVLMLQVRLKRYIRSSQLAEKQWHLVTKSMLYVNGVRTGGQRRGDKKRSLRSDATAFYGALSTVALRTHCTLFGVEYESFESIDEIIEVLVQKHLDMVDAQ